jgi:hypothetical protein
MAAHQPTLRDLPSKSPAGSYVYVLTFSTGIIKVGYTGNPRLRLTAYRTSLSPFGISIVDYWFSDPHSEAATGEAELLDFCRRQGRPVNGGEYFTHIDFRAVVSFARTLPCTPADVPPVAAAEAPASSTPWKQVAEVIRQRIADGTYPPRTRVPSVIQLATEFGIAQATAQKVHRGLREEGLIYTEPGLGSFVKAQPPGS